MNKWLTALMVLIILYSIGSIVALIFFNGVDTGKDKIIIVPIHGVITSDGGSSDIFMQGGVSSAEFVKIIEELGKDNSVKGIIFDIDSPGGTAVASQEIADAVKKLNKTNYALIRDVGASGAYWVASATDKIIASPVSVTGSIGVIGSYLEFSELFDNYGVNYQRLVAGDKKDIGSPFRSLNEEERDLLQNKMDLIHDFFISEVAKNRDLDEEYVRGISAGEFYLGTEALDLGLIDMLGNRDTAIELMKEELGIKNIEVVEKKSEGGILDLFFSNMAYAFGRGFAREVISLDLENRFEIRVLV